MWSFRNRHEASAYADQIADPVTKALVKYSYEQICLSTDHPEGDFDLLYFFKIIHAFVKDRERMAKAFQGDFGENPTGWGE